MTNSVSKKTYGSIQPDVTFLMWLPGLVSTLALIMVNCFDVKNAKQQAAQDMGGQFRVRLNGWLFFSFMVRATMLLVVVLLLVLMLTLPLSLPRPAALRRHHRRGVDHGGPLGQRDADGAQPVAGRRGCGADGDVAVLLNRVLRRARRGAGKHVLSGVSRGRERREKILEKK